jgi:hypothetical protein
MRVVRAVRLAFVAHVCVGLSCPEGSATPAGKGDSCRRSVSLGDDSAATNILLPAMREESSGDKNDLKSAATALRIAIYITGRYTSRRKRPVRAALAAGVLTEVLCDE